MSISALPHVRRPARIGDDDSPTALLFRRQHPFRQNGLRLGNIMTKETQQVGLLYIEMRSNGTVHAKLAIKSVAEVAVHNRVLRAMLGG